MENSNISILIVFLCFLIICSCKKGVKVSLPFEEEKVINILSDFHFAKSASIVHKAEIRDSMRNVYELQVLEINGISKSQYNELIFMLESDLDLYYDIEKKVHKHLKSLQNEKS